MTTEEISDNGENDDDRPHTATEERCRDTHPGISCIDDHCVQHHRVWPGGDKPGASTGERSPHTGPTTGSPPALPRRQSTRTGAAEPEAARVPLITNLKILAEMDLSVATLEYRLAVVNERLDRELVMSTIRKRLRHERDQLHDEIDQRRYLRSVAQGKVRRALPES